MSTTPVKKVSFARTASVPAATIEAAKPVQPIAPAPTVQPAEEAPKPSAALVPQNGDTRIATATYGGEDEVDIGDIRFPRLNIAQKTSAAELVKLGLGNFVLNKEQSLGNTIRIVLVGFQPKKYSEKVKYGSPAGHMASSLDEVNALGGTTIWRESKENAQSGSTKPWFQPMVTGLMLIEKPDGLESDERFVYEANGKWYAPALFTVKSTSYESFYVKLNSEQKLGLLRQGYPTRFIEVKSELRKFTGGEAYQPVVRVLDTTSDEVKALAANLRG